MPTRKDNTNVARIYKEQIVIPASGATLLKQQARPKVAGRPVSSGAIEIVSPEFDLLTGVRGISSLFNNVIGKKLPLNYAYRRASKQELDDIIQSKSFRKIPDNIEVEGGKIITLSNGKIVTFKKAKGNSHGGKAFSAGEAWKGTTSSGNKSSEIIIGVPGNNTKWKVGHHGSYSEPIEFNKISKGEGLFVPFDDNGVADISIKGLKQFTPTRFKNRYISKDIEMKCGGRRKAQLGLDIREGGIAIPIAPNMYYMDGRSHDNGGIAIGPNNKNGLEVEGGEVVKVGKNDVKVFSSVPLLRGVSPAQLVMEGANPNTVFEAQEDFKDKHRINDDGTHYEIGGEKIYIPSKAIQRQIQETGRVTIGGAPTIGGLRTYGYIKSLANVRKYSNAATNIFRIGKELIRRGTEKLVDNGKISRNVAQIPRSIYSQFVGRDGQNLPKTISLINNNMEEKKYGGNMIYTINGNVKNGLLSARPKAEWGKEEKINADTKIGADGLIYKRDARGEWWTDGTMHPSRNKINIDRNIKQYSTKSATNKKLNKVNVDIPYINDKERKKIGSLYYEQNENGQWVPSSNQSVTTTRESGRPSDFGMTRVGINHPNGKYTYHPLTGEKTNYDVVDTDKTTKSTQTSSSSTPRRGTSKTSNSTKASNSAKIVKTKTEPAYINYTPNKVSLAVKADNPTSRTLAKVNTSSTGGGKQSNSDGRWIGQYKPITTSDWIGLAANGLGSIGSYLLTKSGIDKMPDPIKPIMAPAAKLKTRYNVEPQLTNVREAELTNRANVRRNTQSSNISLAREQRLMNEARNASNTLYGQKENIETQLINQDRLNRQSVIRDNVRTYNDYLTRLGANRQAQSQLRISNVNNLISGLTGSVNNILSTIESRRATNNTIRAIAAANPNVDARLIGGFDYYIDPVTKKMYNKNQQYVRTING